MKIRKVLTGLLVVSITASALPARAEAPNGFRASLDRAVANAAVAPGAQSATPQRRGALNVKPAREFASESAVGNAQDISGGGRGMGAVTLIMTLVGTAAGVGATVYMLKQIKKAEGEVR